MSTTNDYLASNSDQTRLIKIFDEDGTTELFASSFSNAQYRVFSTDSNTAIITKSVGSGITVNGDDRYEISFTDDEITDTTFPTSKEYTHQFRLGTTASELLEPYFDRTVTILRYKAA